MKNYGISLYNSNNWEWSLPKIYTNSGWKEVKPFIYTNGQWKMVGNAGTNMIKFITSDGKEFMTSDGKYFLVRDYPILTSITITSMPTKTTYLYEDYFDPAGMVVMGTYTYHGRTITQQLDNYTYDKYGPLQLNDTTIIIKKDNVTTSINITVLNTFDSIVITKNPNKMIYTNGSNFNPDGMEISAIFAHDGVVRKTVPLSSGFTYPNTISSTEAIISYTFGGVTKSTTLDGITLYKVNDVFNYPYSGTYKTITLLPGTYQLECWGAQGGYRSNASYGGKGGYAKGNLTVTEKTLLYIYAGGSGNTGGTAGGFNGGGTRDSQPGGGGGSDIRIGSTSLYARIIVAGGGGSDGQATKAGGYGGGTTGETRSDKYGTGGDGGTQTSAGTTGQAGAFGRGGYGKYSSGGYGGAGGGGWYGGSGVTPDGSGDDEKGGGGGSGYVYTSSTAGNYPSGCLLNSSYYLTNTSLIAGNASFTDYNGSTVTGHSGNGACRITILALN